MPGPAKPAFDGVAWGQAVDGLACGLKLSKDTYRVGETIEGTLYLRNVSAKPRKVHRLVRFSIYGFAIKGPPGGDYTWKGPRYTMKAPGPPDVELAPGQAISATVSPSGQIEQRVDPNGGGMDPTSVLPGGYVLWVSCALYATSGLRTPEVAVQVTR